MRGVLCIALCSLLLGLTSNAIGAPYSTDAKDGDDILLSLPGLLKISDPVTSIVKTVNNLTIKAQAQLKKNIDENVIPKPKTYLKSVHNGVQKSIKDVITKINTTDEFRKLQELSNPKIILSEVEQSIEKYLIDLVAHLNLTKDPELLKELIQAIFEYPESKGKVEILIKKCLADIKYDEYIELSNDLRYEIIGDTIKLIGDIVKYIESYVSEQIKQITCRIEQFAVSEAEDVIEDDINDKIDRIFDDASERNKRKMDDVIDTGSKIVINIGNTEKIF